MICYLDSSVVLRKILNQNQAFTDWSDIEEGYSSRLLRLECLRVIDRLRLSSDVSDEETAESRSRLKRTLLQIGLIPLVEAVFKRAEEPFATPLGSLDSIHLATAIFWRERHGTDLHFITHDQTLGIAARAHGFKVIGCQG